MPTGRTLTGEQAPGSAGACQPAWSEADQLLFDLEFFDKQPDESWRENYYRTGAANQPSADRHPFWMRPHES